MFEAFTAPEARALGETVAPEERALELGALLDLTEAEQAVYDRLSECLPAAGEEAEAKQEQECPSTTCSYSLVTTYCPHAIFV